MKRITVSDVPHMLRMWDYKLNADYPENVSAHDRKPRFWKCPDCKYSWTAAPRVRFERDRCPCHELNMVVLSGVNDVITRVDGFYDLLDKDNDFDAIASHGIKSKKLVNYRCKECGRKWQAAIRSQITKNEEGEYTVKGCSHSNTFRRKHEEIPLCTEIDAIIRFWDDGNPLDPAKTRSASKQRAHFICKNCGYDWSIAINEQANGAGKCRCCELKSVPRKGFSDLFTLVPEAEKNYDFEKNEGIDIYSLPLRDEHTVLNWKCPDCGRERKATLKSCLIGTHGSYSFRHCRCNELSQRQSVNTAEIRTQHIAAVPKYAKYWDYELNKDIDINLTFTDDNREAHWKCKKCGHKWTSKIKNRKKQLDCPKCDRKRHYVEKGKTDVLTLCPELASIYDFETNEHNGIDIYSLSAGSGVVVHFKCQKCKNEWDSQIFKRVIKQNNAYRFVDCPKCSNGSFRPVPYSEQYPDLAKMYREDLNGIPLDSIRGTEAVRKTKYQWDCLICGNTFESTIDAMTHSCQRPTKGCPYCTSRKMSEGKSFAEVHPELMDEYAPDNAEDPYAVFPYSSKNVKWICKTCKHTWFTSFSKRHIGDGNCPVCNRTAVIKDKNSFAAVYPDLAQYWSPKNEKSADEVFYNMSHRWCIFLCPTCEGEYGAWINDFVSVEDHCCPYCRGNRALPGYNSLKALYPEIAKQWSDSNESDSDNVVPTLSVSANWICATCLGEYSAPIRDVVAGTDECPYCKGTRVLPGYNSLKALYPEISRRWSDNNDLDTDNVLPTLSYDKLWICGTCHGEYSAPIRDVVAGTDECPYCKGTRVLPGYNSFADKHPDLIEELDTVSNYLLPFTPNEVLDSSNEKFWWTCKKNKSHNYLMSPRTRLMYDKRSREPCLYCRGHRRKLSHFVTLDAEQQEQ